MRGDAIQPLVSVVIPTYNRRSMVCDAIDSVLDQDFADFEVIVVDDGSTDGTSGFLRARYPEVRLVSREQRTGRSSARNAGLEVARAPYVSFLDSDDRFEPWHLRQLTSGLGAEDGSSWCVRFATANYWDPLTDDLTPHTPPSYLPDDPHLACLVGTFITLPTMLVPRVLAIEVGGFPDNLEGSEDWVFLVRVSRSSQFVPVGGTPSVRVRMHADRSMADVEWDLKWREAALSQLGSELDLAEEELRLLRAGQHRYRAARMYELGDMPAARDELRQVGQQLDFLEAIRWNGRLMVQSFLGERSRRFLKQIRGRLRP